MDKSTSNPVSSEKTAAASTSVDVQSKPKSHAISSDKAMYRGLAIMFLVMGIGSLAMFPAGVILTVGSFIGFKNCINKI